MEERKDLNVTDKYVCFWGSEFSNFQPCAIMAEGQVFTSSEQYFMWQKAKFFRDEVIANAILRAETPRDAKNLGRRVDGFDDETWAGVRMQAMFNAVYCKFEQNEDLRKALLSPEYADKHFVEGSPVDNVWGVGIKFNDPKIADEKNWTGQNLLGQVLDSVREQLLKDEE